MVSSSVGGGVGFIEGWPRGPPPGWERGVQGLGGGHGRVVLGGERQVECGRG